MLVENAQANPSYHHSIVEHSIAARFLLLLPLLPPEHIEVCKRASQKLALAGRKKERNISFLPSEKEISKHAEEVKEKKKGREIADCRQI